MKNNKKIRYTSIAIVVALSVLMIAIGNLIEPVTIYSINNQAISFVKGNQSTKLSDTVAFAGVSLLIVGIFYTLIGTTKRSILSYITNKTLRNIITVVWFITFAIPTILLWWLEVFLGLEIFNIISDNIYYTYGDISYVWDIFGFAFGVIFFSIVLYFKIGASFRSLQE